MATASAGRTSRRTRRNRTSGPTRSPPTSAPAPSWDDVGAEAALDETDRGRTEAWDVLADEPPVAAADPDPDADAVQPPGSRRTVVVTGRPGHLGVPRPDLERRRPPRTVAERLGGSPDRVVGWAVGLGFILILIAILTAGGA